eukprot:comp11699_c0_seq1/m.6249 comp11699_c0_seq1/g.6249  ORF comp11699_c0_seq1/g.6249 comp11699_c0_seq1/m.6249 type:complete len:640 (-) comp11699_c0_seq1:535-2454(-)
MGPKQRKKQATATAAAPPQPAPEPAQGEEALSEAESKAYLEEEVVRLRGVLETLQQTIDKTKGTFVEELGLVTVKFSDTGVSREIPFLDAQRLQRFCTNRDLADHLLALGRPAEAWEALEAAVGDAEVDGQLAVGLANNKAGMYWLQADSPEKAQPYLQQALHTFSALYEQNPKDANNKDSLVKSYVNLGAVHEMQGRIEDALQALRTACSLGGSNLSNPAYPRLLALLSGTGRTKELVHMLCGNLTAKDKEQRAVSACMLQRIYREQHKTQEQIRLLEGQLGVLREFYGADSSTVLTMQLQLADAYQEHGRINDAEQVFVNVLPQALTVLPDQAMVVLRNVGTLHLLQGRMAHAVDFYAACLDRQLQGGLVRDVYVHTSMRLANMLGVLGKYTEGLAAAERALPHARAWFAVSGAVHVYFDNSAGLTAPALAVVDETIPLVPSTDLACPGPRWCMATVAGKQASFRVVDGEGNLHGTAEGGAYEVGEGAYELAEGRIKPVATNFGRSATVELLMVAGLLRWRLAMHDTAEALFREAFGMQRQMDTDNQRVKDLMLLIKQARTTKAGPITVSSEHADSHLCSLMDWPPSRRDSSAASHPLSMKRVLGRKGSAALEVSQHERARQTQELLESLRHMAILP